VRAWKVRLELQCKCAQPIDAFIVPVGRWSDGRAAPVMSDYFILMRHEVGCFDGEVKGFNHGGTQRFTG
jgi:hypothetical protein